MDGVKPISVGLHSFGGRPALVGCAVRIQSQPQSAVPVYNGGRLGRRRSLFAFGHVECQSLVLSCDIRIHHTVAGGILGGKIILPGIKSQPPVCVDPVWLVTGCDICKRIE